MDNPNDRQRVTRMELANRVFFRMYQCANMLHKTGTRAVEAEGLTTQQWAVLGALSHPKAQGGMSVGDLAQHVVNMLGDDLRLIERFTGTPEPPSLDSAPNEEYQSRSGRADPGASSRAERVTSPTVQPLNST